MYTQFYQSDTWINGLLIQSNLMEIGKGVSVDLFFPSISQ